MRRSTLLTALPCLILALTACQGEEAEPLQSPTPGSVTTTGTPTPPDDAASSPGASDHAAASSGPAAETSEVTSEPPVAEVLWHTTDVVPASDPMAVGDALVLYTIEDQRLQITGVDPRDGAVLWSRAATASVRPRGQDLDVEVVDGLVAHLAPVASAPETVGAPAHVILRDPVNGEEVRSSEQALSHADLPAPCPHDDTLTCVTVLVDGVWSLLALTSDGGFMAPPAAGAGVPGWTEIGPLGLSRAADDGTQVGRVVNGHLAWTIDTSEVFGPGQSTDTGWSFGSFGDDSVLVGTIGLGAKPPSDDETWDMTESLALGLDAERGDALWRAAATTTFCDVDLTGTPEDPLLACRWNQGRAVAVDGALTYQDVNIDLVRLDPLTGDPLWEVGLGQTTADGEPARPELRLVSSTEIAVHASDGMRVVDVETGADRPATTTDRHWVEDYDLTDLEAPGAESDQVMVSGRYRLQDGAGEPAGDARWPLPTTIGVELDDGGTVVVADPAGLTAYADPRSGR